MRTLPYIPSRPSSSLPRSCPPLDPHSFPTRRSSDLQELSRSQRCDGELRRRRAARLTDRQRSRARRAHEVRQKRQRYQRRMRERSEEHTSELQSPCNLVCRLLLEKKNCFTIQGRPCALCPTSPPVPLLRFHDPAPPSTHTLSLHDALPIFKNYPDPNDVMENYGADALRAYLIDSAVVRAEPMKFGKNASDTSGECV